MKIPIKDIKGKKQGDLEVKFPLVEDGKGTQAVHDTVVAFQAAQRMGTASTKTMGEVAGTGKKPWRQKGTGRARAGSTRSPLWRKGGTIFGPLPRDYSYHINRKAWRGALCQAISDRAREGKLFVVESLALPELKTKAANAMLAKIGASHALVVVSEGEHDFIRAARNLAAHKVLAVEGLNVYDVIAYAELVMTTATARAIEARLATAEK